MLRLVVKTRLVGGDITFRNCRGHLNISPNFGHACAIPGQNAGDLTEISQSFQLAEVVVQFLQRRG
jgi:hypothetical protein